MSDLDSTVEVTRTQIDLFGREIGATSHGRTVVPADATKAQAEAWAEAINEHSPGESAPVFKCPGGWLAKGRLPLRRQDRRALADAACGGGQMLAWASAQGVTFTLLDRDPNTQSAASRCLAATSRKRRGV